MTRILRFALSGLALASTAPALAQSVFDAAPVGDATLKTLAGREDVNQLTQSNNTATVSRNSVGDNSRTGEARIDGQAFQNLSGLSLVNVNTGNNVAINAAMNVNIAINPGQ